MHLHTLFSKKIILSALAGMMLCSNLSHAGITEVTNTEGTAAQEDDTQSPPLSRELEQIAVLNQVMAHAPLNQQLEIISQHLHQQIDSLAEIVSEIAQIVNNNQVRLIPAEKTAARAELTNLGTLLGKIRYSAFLLTEKEYFPTLTKLIGIMQSNLTTALKSGLKNFPHTEFDVNNVRSVAQNEDVDFAALEQELSESAATIESLNNDAPNVGLSKFNIIYKKLRKLNHDYSILTRTAKVVGIGVLCAWAIYRLHETLFMDPRPKYKPNEHVNALLDSKEKLSEREKMTVAKAKRKMSGGRTKEQGVPHYSNKDLTPTSWKRFFMPIKRFLGFRPPARELGGIGVMTDGTQGILTYVEDTLGEAGLGILSFACPGFPFFIEYVAPKLKQWLKELKKAYDGNLSQIDDYLAGGPVRKVGILSYEKEVSVTLEDVIGNDHVKKWMYRIVAYMTNNEMFDRPGVVPPTGFLFEGDTRTGKTFMAEATAGTIKQILKEMGLSDTLRFVPITASELIEMGIPDFFHEAQNHAPIIIFIDEIDTVGLHRLRDSKRFGEMLTAMSELNRKDKKKVVIIAATNKPEQLDKSFRTSGRFGETLHFSLPTFQERKTFLQKELEKRAIFLEADVVDKLAYESEGSSFDAISEMVRTALMDGKITGKLPRAEDFEQIFNESINKILSDKSPLPVEEQAMVAVHQAGHAVSRILLDPSRLLSKVTTRPISVRIEEEDMLFNNWKDKEEKEKELQKARTTVVYGGCFTMRKPNSLKFDTQQDLLDELTIALAGHAAEKLLYGNTSYSYHTEDNEQAINFAKRIVFEGMREKDIPKDIRERKLQEAHELVAKHKDSAYKLLEQFKEELEYISLILLKHEILTGEEVEGVIAYIRSEKAKQKDDAPQNASETPAESTALAAA